jgi:hypothetical protein
MRAEVPAELWERIDAVMLEHARSRPLRAAG